MTSDLVDRLLQEELLRIEQIRRARTARALKLLVLGTILISSSLLMLFLSSMSEQFKDFLMLVAMTNLFIAFLFVNAATAARKSVQELRVLGGGNYKFTAVLKCFSCNYEKERELKEGEYIGMLAERCEKCGSRMRIIAIYGRPEKEPEPIPYFPQLTI